MRVNQKDTGAGTHNFTCPNLSSDYDTLIKKMNSEYFKDPIVKFIYDSEIVLDANYDLNKDGILNIDDINTIEFIPIKDSFYNEIMRLGRDTFKTIFVFLTND